jgi:hypothetical protein
MVSPSAEQQPTPCNTREHAARRQKTKEIAGFFSLFSVRKATFFGNCAFN